MTKSHLMRIRAMKDGEKRSKYRAIVTKRIKILFKSPCRTIPVFIFGKQRSGTTMLVNCFHLYPDMEVFDESANNKAFLNYRIRSLDKVRELIRISKFPFICFKPISDSHIISEFIVHFLEGRFIWIYRNYKDVASSSLRYFPHATSAVKIVCNGQKGGGWFQEGVSKESVEVLKSLSHSHHLSEFDYACLAWWTRNKIFFEHALNTMSNLILVSYEDIVSEPNYFLNFLCKFLGARACVNPAKFIFDKSIRKYVYPEITPSVCKLCEDLQKKLDNCAVNFS